MQNISVLITCNETGAILKPQDYGLLKQTAFAKKDWGSKFSTTFVADENNNYIRAIYRYKMYISASTL